MAEKWNPKAKPPSERGYYQARWYEERQGLKVGRPRSPGGIRCGGQASPGTPETGVVRLEAWRGPKRENRFT